MTGRRPLPSRAGAGLGIVFLSFPGLLLPLDLIYALPGMLTYATMKQLAAIFLYLVALSLVTSLAACLMCAAAGAVVAKLAKTTAADAISAAATRAGSMLVAFGVMHGVTMWVASVLGLLQMQSASVPVALAASLATAVVPLRRLPSSWLTQIFLGLRASTLLVALLALASAVAVSLPPQARGAPAATIVPVGKRPPIILITVDTFSALHLRLYGYHRETAPRLSQFARHATVFLRNYANANFTTSSMASIMYGTRPWTHRVIQHEGKAVGRAPESSLPAVLRAAHYDTVSISTNPWAAPRNLSIAQYFSLVEENNVCAVSDPMWVLPTDLEVAAKTSLVWSSLLSLVARASDALALCEGRHFDPELALSKARNVLARAPADRPLFLWVHLFPPHDPYITPEPFVDEFVSDPRARDRTSTIPPYLFDAMYRLDFPGLWLLRYDQAIRYVDHHIGKFLDTLKSTGVYDKALIVITADHGESLSKGYGGHGGPALHEELIRIPLLIKEPGQTEGYVVKELSEQIDVMPTILELAGIHAPRQSEGISLVSALRGARLSRPVFSMNFQQSTRLGTLDTGLVAMVDGTWKYVHYFGHIYYPGMPELKDALYELASDPRETHNKIASRPAVAARMLKSVEDELRRHGSRIE